MSIVQQKNIKLKDNSKVKTFKLVWQPARQGKIFIGSKETNSYIVVDSYWRHFTKLINKNFPLNEIAKKLSMSNTKAKLMVIALIQNKLVHKIDKNIILKRNRKAPRDYIANMNPIFISLFTFLAIFALIILVLVPKFFPKPSDFFWSNYLSLSLLSSFIFTWISAIGHELAHLTIAKLYGINGKLALSHRLNFLVIETQFSDIYAIPKKGRIAIYVSGIAVDMAATTILYLILFLNNSAVVKQFILLEWLSISWQFFFYMKTDVYFVIREIFGIENLYTYAKQNLFNISKSKKINQQLTNKESMLVNIYTFFFAAGTTLGILRYTFYTIPILLTLILESLQKIIAGIYLKNSIYVFDGGVVLAVEVILNLLLIYSIIKNGYYS